MEDTNDVDRRSAGTACYAAYRTILIDPPWKQDNMGQWNRRSRTARRLPYKTMTLEEICRLPVGDMAADGCHLWLWTTNQFLREGFECLDAWGFKYLAPVTWVKPSGCGAWFVHRTQTILFGYRPPLKMDRGRYLPTVFEANPGRHSAKPEVAYEMIESVSDGPRVELFARPWSPLFPIRDGWDVWGNEIRSTVELPATDCEHVESFIDMNGGFTGCLKCGRAM